MIDSHQHFWNYRAEDYPWMSEEMGVLRRDYLPGDLEAEISGLIDRLEGDRVGLVAFSGAAFVQCPLTSDYAAAKLFLRAMEAGGIPVGVSCLCPGWVRTGIGDSDRNWPDELGALPERDAAGEVARKYLTRALDEGMQPAAVADLVR